MSTLKQHRTDLTQNTNLPNNNKIDHEQKYLSLQRAGIHVATLPL